MASVLKSYALNYTQNNFDSIIEKKCIYNLFLYNKNNSHWTQNEYISLTYKLFYANLTFVEHPIRKESTFFTSENWSWDTIHKAYLWEDKQTTKTIGILLKIE